MRVTKSWQKNWLAFCAAVSLLGFPSPFHGEVVISEFLAENDTGLRDEDGEQVDWIELHNDGDAPVNLAGWRLTDDAQSAAKWLFPAVTVNPGEYLVVFASGKDRRVAGNVLHTNFRLSKDGGYLALSKPDGTITREFSAYPRQRADVSFGDGVLVEREELVSANSTARYFVPTDGSLGTLWTERDFAENGWTLSSTRIGYQLGGARPGLPQAHWSFDDVTANSVVNGPSASLGGATYDPSVPGSIGEGKSLRFVQSAQNYMSAPLDVSETSFTSSFWFRTNSPNIGLFTVVDGDLGAGGFDRLLYLQNGNIFARVWDNQTIGSSGKNYADGQWHHVAHVLGSAIGGQRIYVDGVQVATGTKAVSNFNWQQRINLGFCNDAGTNSYFNGHMDDLAIWSEALNATSIAALATGTPPMSLAGFAPYIATNVEGALRNAGSSIYLRVPFVVNRAEPFNRASLRVRYDDGFVAYIDGVEVARRNAPVAPIHSSTASSDRAADDAVWIEEIDLNAHTGLLSNGNHVLAVHGLNDAAASADFLLNAELVAARETVQTDIYMEPVTPGELNSSGFVGFVGDTSFTPRRGFYDVAQTVSIASATPGASIAYTLNGTDPSPTNGIQVHATGPNVGPIASIPVSSTSSIRAMAYKTSSGMKATNVDCHTYIFPHQILVQPSAPPGYPASWQGRTADYAMDPNVVNTALPGYGAGEALLALPSISLTTTVQDLFGVPSGIYYDTQLRGFGAERKVSVEWINPNGSPGWHVQCGTRLHGNSSRSHGFTPKHPMRLLFRRDYGASRLRVDLYGGGVDSFDELLLQPCSTDSMPVVDGNVEDGVQRWNNDKATYLRDQWVRDTLNALGHPNARARYCHLYINGLYWGIYKLSERPTAAFFSDTFGGEEDEWDVLKDFAEVANGDAAAWNAMMAIVNDGTLSHEARAQKLIGRNPDGTVNPSLPIYLHLPSFIDYMIVHIGAGAEDWPDHNWWVGRRRGALSDGFRFVAWDQEISNDSLTRASGRGSGNPFEAVGNPANQSPPDRNGPAGIYDTLRRAPSFQAKFRERIHELLFNEGPLSPAASRARWLLRQAEIDRAMVAESARWGDAAGEGIKKRETTWLANMNFMNTPGSGYWDAIFPIQVQRFRNVGLYPSINQPGFSKEGGVVPPGHELFLSTDQPAAYYTTDGTDPMGPNGQPAPGAILYQGGITTTQVISKGAEWKYHTSGSASAPGWKDLSFDDSSWPSGPGQLGYGDGDEATLLPFGPDPANRYITTYFRRSFSLTAPPEAANLRLLRDDGAVVYLNGKEVARSNMHPTNPVTHTTTALSNAGGADESTFYYAISLAPADFVIGENLLAIEVHKSGPQEDDLSFDASLEVATNANASAIVLSESCTVTARARSSTGEWSGKKTAYFVVGAVLADPSNLVVSELHYQPAPPQRPQELAVSADADDFEFIELLNIANSPLDLTGVEFGAGITFAFPPEYVLPPSGRCVVVRNAAAFAARYGSGIPVAGEFAAETGLNNNGETITLIRSDSLGSSVTLKSFTYGVSSPWPGAAKGNGPSLVLKQPFSNPNHNAPTNWVASADEGGTPGVSPDGLTFGMWKTRYADELDPVLDTDGDGMANLVEYAFRSNPLASETQPCSSSVVTVDGDPFLTVTFRYRPSSDLTISVEESSNLVSWQIGPILISDQDHGDGSRTETWRASEPIDSATGGGFLRVRVTWEP